MGLGRSICGHETEMGLVFAVIGVAVVFLSVDQMFVDLASSVVSSETQPTEFSYKRMLPPRGPDTGGYRILATLYLSVSAGIVEEILYRGMLRRVFPDGTAYGVLFLIISAETLR